MVTNEFFGATVGRVANRIANGRFILDGKTYNTPVNDGPNSLHGGTKGFDKVRHNNILRVASADAIQKEREQDLARRKALAEVEDTFIKSFSLTGQMTPDFTGASPAGTTITCRITVDGEVIAEQTSTGEYAIVTCSGS